MRSHPVATHLNYLYALSFRLVCHPLSRVLVRKLVGLAKKHQFRLAREMKRSICKKCFSLLVPVITSETCLEKSVAGLGLAVTCKACGYTRKFMMKGEKGLRRTQ